MRAEAFLGYHDWDELAGLTPAADGRFDSGGFNLGGALHWHMQERERRSLLLGVDVALFSNDSSVTHVREDLRSRGLYITPSLKLTFGGDTKPRYVIDFGVGYYLVDIAEVELYRLGDYSEVQLWEDSAFGGYIGAGIDFPSKRNGTQRGFFVSVKAHFLDLGNIRDEGVTFVPPGTLGANAGPLSGPVAMLQFGYHWN